MSAVAVNPATDWSAAAAAWAARGRVRLDDFLAPASAAALFAELAASPHWRRILNNGDKLFELTRDQQAALTPEQRAELARAVDAQAQRGFQYHYETIRIPDEPAARAVDPSLAAAFARALSEPPLLDRLRALAGAPDIAFADAQCTAYAPGDFLTAHDDAVAGKGRRAAYVLGLSPDWRADWGGLLLFHGEPAEAWVPRFNTLNLFAVPQPHSVSQVASFAPARRYAITGWLRAA